MSLDHTLRAMIREEIKHLLPQMLPGQEEYMTTAQVAAMTGLSKSYFEVARHHGSEDQPPYMRVGRRIVYKRSEVEGWLAGRARK